MRRARSFDAPVRAHAPDSCTAVEGRGVTATMSPARTVRELFAFSLRFNPFG